MQIRGFISGLMGGLLVLGLYLYLGPQPNTIVYESKVPVQQTGQIHYSGNTEAPDFTRAADLTLNSVVHIKIRARGQDRFYDPVRDFFFWNPNTRPQPRIQSGSGSGVIIDHEGHIITNNHVVANAEEIEVVLNDQRNFKARLVGTDPSTDLAVVKIEADMLNPIVFGNSDEVKVGEWVMAIGNPFNLSSTVTAGIVSAKARNIDVIRENYKIESFIQTDAAVNPGNSGGALVNIQGELIGINTAIASNTGSFSGYAFAIPANLARKIATDLIEFGTAQRGFLGISIRDLDPDKAREMGIPLSRGIWVDAPMAGGAAEEAGIRPGDIILAVGEIPVKTVSELQEQIGLFRPGDRVKLLIYRNRREEWVEVTLKNKSGTTRLLDKKAEIKESFGAEFESVPDQELYRLGVRNGIRVKNMKDGLLRQLGIRPGFIITEMNGKPIRQIDDLNQASAGTGRFYIGGVYPTGEKVYYSFH